MTIWNAYTLWIATRLLGITLAVPPDAPKDAPSNTWAGLLRSPTAIIDDGRVVELSSIAPARSPGEFWGANDSGHPPVIFRFTREGRVRQAVTLDGAENVDWEAMTRDGRGRLLVADTGDNARRRGSYTIYVVSEPAAGAASIAPLGTIVFRYADGGSRDCEAVFSLDGQVYLISRENGPATATVFRLDQEDKAGRTADDAERTADDAGRTTGDPAGARPPLLGELGLPDPETDGPADEARDPRPFRIQAVATALERLPIGLPVTGAACSPDRRELAVLTYAGASVFRVAGEADLGRPAVRTHLGFFGQAEAITFDGDALLIANEKGALWRLP